jgi:hypothetical protein
LANRRAFDTLGRFAAFRGDGENSSGEADAAMAPLLQAAATGLAVIVVRHERKAGGDVGDAGRGSSAFGGAADIVVSIRRAEGNGRPSIRAIHALSRFDETPEELMVELTGDGYVALGEAAAVESARVMDAVLATLRLGPGAGLRMDDLAGETSAHRTTLQTALEELIAAGSVVRTGRGVKNKPYRYTLAALERDDRAVVPPFREPPDDPDWVIGTA